jgi:hypothetical protein
MAKKNRFVAEDENMHAPPELTVVPELQAASPVQASPQLWTPEERRLQKAIFDKLFWLEPRTREEGQKRLDELGELAQDILEDAEAQHLAKLSAKETPLERKLRAKLNELAKLK